MRNSETKGDTMKVIGQISDNGSTYDILQSYTADEVEAQGKPNLARHMRDLRAVRRMVVKRPRGRKLYSLTEYRSPVGVATYCGTLNDLHTRI